jgi:uncharacterized protein YyaL (SSP411 family)
LNLLMLAHLTDDEDARRRAERTLARYGERAGRAARVIPMMLAGLSTWHAGAMQVVLVGEGGAGLKTEVARHYLPFAVLIPVRPGPQQETLARILPFIAAMRPLAGAPTAFVCRDFACREPVSDSHALAEQLRPTA